MIVTNRQRHLSYALNFHHLSSLFIVLSCHHRLNDVHWTNSWIILSMVDDIHWNATVRCDNLHLDWLLRVLCLSQYFVPVCALSITLYQHYMPTSTTTTTTTTTNVVTSVVTWAVIPQWAMVSSRSIFYLASIVMTTTVVVVFIYNFTLDLFFYWSIINQTSIFLLLFWLVVVVPFNFLFKPICVFFLYIRSLLKICVQMKEGSHVNRDLSLWSCKLMKQKHHPNR